MAVLKLENCAADRSPGRLLRSVHKLMTTYVESRFPVQDLSFMHWVALKVVREGAVRSAGELARELGITTGATTRMIDALEQRGLIERDRGAADRRVVRLAITEEGRAVADDLQRPVVEAWNEVLADFDQAEVDRMIVGLMRLRDAARRAVDEREYGDAIAEAAE